MQIESITNSTSCGDLRDLITAKTGHWPNVSIYQLITGRYCSYTSHIMPLQPVNVSLSIPYCNCILKINLIRFLKQTSKILQKGVSMHEDLLLCDGRLCLLYQTLIRQILIASYCNIYKCTSLREYCIAPSAAFQYSRQKAQGLQ